MFEPTRIDIPDRHRDIWASWGFVFLIFPAYLLRFGYGFGFSDQDEFLPLIMHWQNADLFARDWFVMEQASSFGVRTIFARVLYLLALAAPLKVIVAVLHFFTFAAVSTAIFRVANKLYRNRLTAGLAVFTVLLLTSRWNPGGNDLFHSMLVPSSMSWALALWSFERVLHKRYLMAGALSGAAMLIHPLVGLQVGVVIAVSIYFTEAPRKRVLTAFLVPFLVVATPLIIVLTGWEIHEPANSSSFSAAFILTQLRAPHHYLPGAFQVSSVVKLAIISILGFVILWTERLPLVASRRFLSYQDGPARQYLLTTSIILLLLLLGAYALTSIWPTSTVTRLQPFNLSVMLRITVVIALSGVVSGLIPRRMRRRIATEIRKSSFPVAAGLVALFVVTVATQFDTLKVRTFPSDLSKIELHDWIQLNTQQNAVFAIPPSMSGFQVGSRRAQYVSFKSYPFEAKASEEWLRRLLRVAPVQDLRPGGVELQARLDKAYAEHNSKNWKEILEKEEIDFIVRVRTDQPDGWSTIDPAWCSSSWCVYWAGRILLTP